MTIGPTGRHSARPLLLTAAYYASFILLGLATAAEGPSLPTLARHTASALDRISLIFVTGALGYLIGSLAGGRAYDRWPGHRVMAAMLLCMTLAAVVYPLASVLGLLLLAAFIMGLAKGAVDVGCNTLLQWVHDGSVGPYMNGLHFAFGLGSFFAPILLAQTLAATGDIYWVFWIIAILIVPLAFWLWLLPSPSVAGETGGPAAGTVSLAPVLLVVLAFFLYVGAEVGFSNWLYTYAITLGLEDTIRAAYLTSVFWALFTLGRLLGVWVSTRLAPRLILALDFVGCLLSLACIAAVPGSIAVLWLGSAGLGLSMASIFPTILMLAGEKLQVSGTVTGWFLVGAGAGGMLLPWLIGNAFTLSGPHTMLVLVLADLFLDALVLAGLAVWVAPPREKTQRLAPFEREDTP